MPTYNQIAGWSIKLATMTFLGVAMRGGVADADTLKLKTGRTLEGKVESRTDELIRFRTEPGVVDVKVSDVLKLDIGPAPWDQFERIQGDYPGTADGHYALGLWCRSHGLPGQARKCFQQALDLDPEHAGARAALGGSAESKVTPAATQRTASSRAGMTTPEDKLLRELITQWHVRISNIYSVKLKNRDARSEAFSDGRDQIMAIHDPLAVVSIAGILARGTAPVRLLMVESLASFTGDGKDEATMNLIVTALFDPEPSVRAAAARALIPRKDARVTGRLRKALSSKEDTVVRNAAVALGVIKAKDAVPDMATVLYTVERRTVRYARAEIIGDVVNVYGTRMIVPHGQGSLYYQPGLGVLGAQTVVGTTWVDEVRDVQNFRTDVQEALIAITGQNLGFDPDAWIKWARENP